MVQDVIRQGISPATGADQGSQAVTDFNHRIDGALNIPNGETNTLNGAKDRDGYIRLTRNSDGDLVLNSYADGKWTEYIAVLDGLKSIGGITLDENNVTVIAPVKWRINSINYEKSTNTVLTVMPATDGNKRIDYIYADTNSNILLIEGTEVPDGNPYIPPTLPNNTILVAPVYISGSAIEPPKPDLTGFLTKAMADGLYAPIRESLNYVQINPTVTQEGMMRLRGNIETEGDINALEGVTRLGETHTKELEVLTLGGGNVDTGLKVKNGNFGFGKATLIFESGTQTSSIYLGGQNYNDETPSTLYFTFNGEKYFLVNDDSITNVKKLTGSELFAITDPKDYVQSGYVEQMSMINTKSYDVNSVGSSFTLLTDSLGESAGASSYSKGYGNQVMRSIMNSSDKSYPRNRGYGYHTIINAANSTSGLGITTNGSYINSGVVASRLRLTAGQTITITNRNFNFCDFFYDASSSNGTLELRLNGVLVATKTISGTGIQNTFPTVIKEFIETKLSDVVTVTATGTIVILGIQTLRAAQDSPLGYIVSKSGYGLQDFNTSTALDEIANYVNFSSGTNKTLAIALGTNNIYQPERALSPSEYISNLSSLIDGINSRCGKVNYILTVPPRSNESVFPVILNNFTYQDYVNAIVNFSIQNDYVTIRYDKTVLGTGNSKYLSDNIHFNDEGHTIAAGLWVENLNILLDASSMGDVNPFTLQDVAINGFDNSVNAATTTKNIEISNTSEDSDRWININGAGGNRKYGIKLSNVFRFYDNTGASETTIDPKSDLLRINGKLTVVSNGDALLTQTNAQSVLALFDNTGGYSAIFRLRNTNGFSDIQKNMDGSLTFDINDVDALVINNDLTITIPTLSGAITRPLAADGNGTLIIDTNTYQIQLPDNAFTHASPPTSTSTGKRGSIWIDPTDKTMYVWYAENMVSRYFADPSF